MDRRRYNAPESQPIQRHPTKFSSKDKGKSPEARLDGRADGDIRPIFLKTGLITQASGSCYVETGKTKLICAVYGPHPIRRDAPFSSKAQLNVEVKYAPFACGSRHRTAGKDTEANHLSSKLEQALKPALRLELLPKSAIDLFVHVLECDGPIQDISCGITAASLALSSAGVEMYGLVIGSCASITISEDNNKRLLLDPTDAESQELHCLIGLASIPAMGTITNLTLEGKVEPALMQETLDKLNVVSQDVHAVAAKVLLDSLRL